MAQAVPRLRIIAQPKAFHRERYLSEQDPGRCRAQRFIRAGTNLNNLGYPTIEIPKQWNNRRIYIRVTLTTVMTEEVPVVCIHPYQIDSREANVIRDFERNTLFFPVTDAEINQGQKSFRLIRRKLIQYELRRCRQLTLLNKDEKDIQRTTEPHDARKLIDAYQLGKSQLLFSVAELLQDGALPVIYDTTSVYSNVMTAGTPSPSTNDDDLFIRYAPQKGDWNGNDEIIMFLPKIDRRKGCHVYFDHPLMKQGDPIPVQSVDSKTIAFVTPPCPVPPNGNQRIEIPVVVTQSGEEIARVNFLYQSCNSCSTCNTNIMFEFFDTSNPSDQSSTSDMHLDDSDSFIYDNDQDIKSENDLS